MLDRFSMCSRASSSQASGSCVRIMPLACPPVAVSPRLAHRRAWHPARIPCLFQTLVLLHRMQVRVWRFSRTSTRNISSRVECLVGRWRSPLSFWDGARSPVGAWSEALGGALLFSWLVSRVPSVLLGGCNSLVFSVAVATASVSNICTFAPS